ncbi:MAG: DUF2169 domain-containing protein [Polyangiaceae bacterium]|nr:DUF2169 domain-containing protein [Polyangiaceae bacterium]
MTDTHRPRTSNVLSDPRIAATTALYSQRGEQFITLIGKWTARVRVDDVASLTDPAPIRHRAEYTDYTSSTSSLRIPSDLAPRLLAADVLLHASAYQVGGRSAPSRVVALGIHRNGTPLLHKRLYVYGDRAADGSLLPFRSMPLEWERAFGGPRSELNPAGCGMDPGSKAPNIVDARNGRIPGGFGALSPAWPIRARLLGGHSPIALEGADAHLPDGLSFAFFQVAPLDQRVGFLSGDEWLVFDGMHPTMERFQTRLPGIVIAGRVSRRDESMSEVPMVLDRLSIDLDEMTMEAVFRGSLPIKDDPRDLTAMFGVQLPTRPGTCIVETIWPERRPERDARPKTLAMNSDSHSAAAVRPATPYVEPAPQPGRVAMAPGAPWAGPAPVTPPAAGLASTMPLLSEMMAVEDTVTADSVKVPSVDRVVPEPPPSMPRPPPVAPEQPAEPPPSVDAPETAVSEETGLRKMVLDRVADKGRVDFDLTGADLSGLDLSSARLDGARLERANLAGAKLDGANLKGARMAGADLRGASLRSADLSEALLSRAILDGADMEEASFVAADLQTASALAAIFRRSRCERARLSQLSARGATFEEAILREADLTGATVEGVTFDGANVSAAMLGGLRAERASFRRARLDDVKAMGATLVDCEADECSFERAALEAAELSNGRLANAIFRGATLTRARLDGVEAPGACFDGAVLAGASLIKANLADASLVKADLRQARLAGATARGARFGACNAQKIIASHADLGAANLTGASFRFAKLDGADLRGAEVEGCDFRDANMQDSKLAGIRRDGARMGGANLKGAIFE